MVTRMQLKANLAVGSWRHWLRCKATLSHTFSVYPSLGVTIAERGWLSLVHLALNLMSQFKCVLDHKELDLLGAAVTPVQA